MEGISAEYLPNSVDPGINELRPELHLYMIDDSEQDACDSHAHMFHLL